MYIGKTGYIMAVDTRVKKSINDLNSKQEGFEQENELLTPPFKYILQCFWISMGISIKLGFGCFDY